MPGYRMLTATALSICSAAAIAAEQDQHPINKIIENVTVLCTLPSQRGEVLEYSGSLEGSTLIKLVGVKGQGKLSKEEWEGIQDVLEKDRATDRISSRECVQNMVPIFLKAYGVDSEVQSVARHEAKVEKGLQNPDPGSRSLAFREAFKSVGVFTIDLEPHEGGRVYAVQQEGQWENRINAPVAYYEYETGKFREHERASMAGLTGHISGDTISFRNGSCSGSLYNVEGTWMFEGPVTCSVDTYLGKFRLR